MKWELTYAESSYIYVGSEMYSLLSASVQLVRSASASVEMKPMVSVALRAMKAVMSYLITDFRLVARVRVIFLPRF